MKIVTSDLCKPIMLTHKSKYKNVHKRKTVYNKVHFTTQLKVVQDILNVIVRGTLLLFMFNTPKIDLPKCMHVFGEAVRSLIMTKHICCLFNFHSLNRRNLSCSTSQKSLLPKCMHVFGEVVRSLNMTKQISRHKQQGFSHNYSENCYIRFMQANNVEVPNFPNK